MKKIITILLIMMVTVSCSSFKNEAKYSKEPFVKVTGGWETNGNNPSYYVFKEDGTFFWYKTADDLSDNYYTGEYEMLIGADAATDLGINLANILEISVISNGKVTADDIYSITMKITKLISGGKDKTDTLEEDRTMKMLFIYLNEYNAQGYNFNFDHKYYLVRNDVYKEK